MKKFVFSSIIFVFGLLISNGQVPQALKYKAIAKDEWGIALPSKDVTLQFTILQDDIDVYREIHYTTTNKFGLMDVNVGEGIPLLGYFDEIDWGVGVYTMKVELDPKGGTDFRLEGSDRLLSVPYALFAGDIVNTADNDSDPQNELIQDMYLSGTVLYILEADQTIMVDLYDLQDGTEDADADPTNEIQDLQLNGNILTITQNGAPTEINLGDYLDNTDTQLTEMEVDAMVANNGYLTDELDADPTNEIQDLQLVGNVLTITLNGTPTTINLEPYLDNTDAQQLTLSDHLLSLSNGGDVVLPDNVDDADADPSNELQILTIRYDTIFLSDGGFVKLPATGNVLGSFVYGDSDGDGFGDMYKALWVPELAPVPDGYLTDNTDCNDMDASINPLAGEIIGDGIDNNCDGETDVFDYSECATIIQGVFDCGVSNGCDVTDMLCIQEYCQSEMTGFYSCLDLACMINTFQDPESIPWDETWTTEEIADYLLSTCGNADEDGDGYSAAENDCDDSDPAINPGRIDICGDGIDQDCSGSDEICGPLDTDDDGDGYTENEGDCNDDNAAIHPTATEICNGIDDDCDEITDEGTSGDCELPNANSECLGGSCAIQSCDNGYADCDGYVANGCETVLDQNPSCLSYISIGTIYGDETSSITIHNYGEKWFQVYISESNSACVDLSARISLVSASDTDYDLYVYAESCSGTLMGSSTLGTGQTDVVSISWDDLCAGGLPLGTDEGMYVYIKVAYYSANSCEVYTLNIDGNTN